MIETRCIPFRYGRMTVPANDRFIAPSLERYGEWAQLETDLLLALTPAGSSVVMGGANFGAQTIAVARHVGAGGAVLAFEPQPVAYDLLTRNLRDNDLANVSPRRQGLGAEPGEVLLSADPGAEEASFNYGNLPLVSNASPETGHRVAVIRLDDLHLEACDLLHLDVEGMEPAVLRGAADTIARLRPVVYAEARTVEEAAGTFALLRDAGYRLWLHAPPAFNPDNHAGNPDDSFFGPAVETALLAIPPTRMGDLGRAVAETEHLAEIGSLDDLARALLAQRHFIVRVFWADSPAEMVPNQCVARCVRADEGRTTLELHLPAGAAPRCLRLDPCAGPGLVSLDRLRLEAASDRGRRTVLDLAGAARIARGVTLCRMAFAPEPLGGVFVATAPGPQCILYPDPYALSDTEHLVLSVATAPPTTLVPGPAGTFGVTGRAGRAADLLETVSGKCDQLGAALDALQRRAASEDAAGTSADLVGRLETISGRIEQLEARARESQHRQSSLREAVDDLVARSNRIEELQITDAATTRQAVERATESLSDLAARHREALAALAEVHRATAGIDEVRERIDALSAAHAVARPPRPDAGLGAWLRPSQLANRLRLWRRRRLLLASGLFDADYYRRENPDVAEAGVDPALHYLHVGARQGRNPHPDFNTRRYLERNPDVKARGMNPLVHYIRHGRSEGRPIGTRQRPAAPAPARVVARGDGAREPAAVEAAPVAPDALADRIRQSLSFAQFVIACSHDDYLRSVGGVQVCMADEAHALRGMERDYVHLCPAQALDRLSERTDDLALHLNVGEKALGRFRARDVIDALTALAATHESPCLAVLCHQLLGWNLEVIDRLLAAARPRHKVFWVHDYFSICPQYNLLRNGRAFCHAPPVDSNACTICRHGPARRESQPAFRRLLAAHDFTVVAPSRFALDLWSREFDVPRQRRLVVPHVDPVELDQAASNLLRLPDVNERLRVAYLGHPFPRKGWSAWRRFVDENPLAEAHDLYHLGSGGGQGREMFVPVRVGPGDRTAMIDALRAHRIDVAVLYSIWPETFGYVLYEAMAAGCYVLTHRDSGNIADTVGRRGNGLVLGGEDELVEVLGAPVRLRLRVQEFRTAQPRLYDLRRQVTVPELLAGRRTAPAAPSLAET